MAQWKRVRLGSQVPGSSLTSAAQKLGKLRIQVKYPDWLLKLTERVIRSVEIGVHQRKMIHNINFTFINLT